LIELLIKDKWFFGVTLLLAFTILADSVFTIGGMNLGYREGNPIAVFSFTIVGVIPTIISGIIIQFVVIAILNFIRNRLNDKKYIGALYFIVSLAILVKAFFVGAWIGMIKATMGY